MGLFYVFGYIFIVTVAKYWKKSSQLITLYNMTSATSKKLQNVYKRCPKLISREKSKILLTLQKLPKNVGDLGKLIVAKAMKRCPKSNKSPNLVTLYSMTQIGVSIVRWSILTFCSMHFSIFWPQDVTWSDKSFLVNRTTTSSKRHILIETMDSLLAFKEARRGYLDFYKLISNCISG